MSLTVVSFATYLTNTHTPWRDEDHWALKFVKAVKGKPFGGYAWVRVAGEPKRLNQENAEEAIDWFGIMAAEYLEDHVRDDIQLVPIPNSHCTKASEIPRTKRLALAIAARVGVHVLDGLRWKAAMTPSSKGGTRNPQDLYDNLIEVRKLADSKIILVDDVRTKGAHLVAAKAFLRAKNAKCLMALCAGRTELAPEQNPFAVVEQDLPNFEPLK